MRSTPTRRPAGIGGPHGSPYRELGVPEADEIARRHDSAARSLPPMVLVVCRGEMRADLVGFGGAEVGVEAERLLPVAAGLVESADGVVGPGEPAVGAGFVLFPADLGGQFQRGGMLGAGAFGLALVGEDFAEAVEGLGLVFLVAGLLDKGQCLLEMAGGLFMTALAQAHLAEPDQRRGLVIAVAELPGQGQSLVELPGRVLVRTPAQADL